MNLPSESHRASKRAPHQPAAVGVASGQFCLGPKCSQPMVLLPSIVPSYHPPSIRPTPPRRIMAKDYQRLWEHVTSATDEAKAVRTLAEILADRDGGTFISRLERKHAELCIEILDHVSRDLHPLPSSVVSDGFIRASQSTTSKFPRSRLSSSH